jgi:hypothetical protein
LLDPSERRTDWRSTSCAPRAPAASAVGDWLPEPIITDGKDDPARHAETADSLSLAMLVLLESLSPEQRAVLLLYDVFDYGLPKSQESSVRARTTCASSPPAPDATSSSAGPASKPSRRWWRADCVPSARTAAAR